MNKLNKDIVKLKLYIKAKCANPAPPVGPALGQCGVNIPLFCKQFNKRTENLYNSVLLPVVITVKQDRSFFFSIKNPPVSRLIFNFISLNQKSNMNRRHDKNTIKMHDICKIAKIKSIEMVGSDKVAAINMICGTAISLGVNII